MQPNLVFFKLLTRWLFKVPDGILLHFAHSTDVTSFKVMGRHWSQREPFSVLLFWHSEHWGVGAGNCGDEPDRLFDWTEGTSVAWESCWLEHWTQWVREFAIKTLHWVQVFRTRGARQGRPRGITLKKNFNYYLSIITKSDQIAIVVCPLCRSNCEFYSNGTFNWKTQPLKIRYETFFVGLREK